MMCDADQGPRADEMHESLMVMMEADRPAWVLTTARSHELQRAAKREGFDFEDEHADEELRRFVHSVWPDLPWKLIEEGFRYAAMGFDGGLDCWFIYCETDGFHGPFSEHMAKVNAQRYDGPDSFYCGPHRVEKDYEKAERLYRG